MKNLIKNQIIEKLISSNFFVFKDLFAVSANITDILPSSKFARGLIFFLQNLAKSYNWFLNASEYLSIKKFLKDRLLPVEFLK